MSIFKKKKNISKVSNYMQTYEEEKIIKNIKNQDTDAENLN